MPNSNSLSPVPARAADPSSSATRMLVEYVRRLADTDPGRLGQVFDGLIGHLVEQLPDSDLARAIGRTLSPEVEPLVLIEATRALPELVPDNSGFADDLDQAAAEWDATSRLDGVAVRSLVEAVSG